MPSKVESNNNIKRFFRIATAAAFLALSQAATKAEGLEFAPNKDGTVTAILKGNDENTGLLMDDMVSYGGVDEITDFNGGYDSNHMSTYDSPTDSFGSYDDNAPIVEGETPRARKPESPEIEKSE